MFNSHYFETYMIAQIVTFPWSLASVIAWAIVAVGAGWAVFAPTIRDIVTERIALSTISVAAVSRAYYVWDTGAVSLDGLVVSLALGLYIIVMFYKHVILIPRWRRYNRRNDFYSTKR